MFLKGALRMPKSKRRWNEDAIAKLKAMAGKEPGERIAAVLGRTLVRQRYKPRSEGFRCASNVPAETARQTKMVHQREAFFNFPGIE